MKKHILSFIAGIIATTAVMAQTINSTSVQIGDIAIPAFTITVPQDEDLVEDALKQKFKEAKVKTTKAHGYVAVIGQTFGAIGSSPVNFYTKLEGAGRRGKQGTTITFAAMASDVSVNQELVSSNTRDALSEFAQYVDHYEASQLLEEEQKKVQKAQKNLESAQKKAEGLAKDMEKAQSKISSKKDDIVKLNNKVTDIKKEITSLESEIRKTTEKKAEIDKQVEEAAQQLKNAQAEMQKYELRVR